jgi:hypothetical protein
VINQVTILVSGQYNGADVSVRIRVDNVVYKDGVLDLVEAKYSVTQITGKKYVYSLTDNQKEAFKIIADGKNVNIFVRGDKLANLGFPSGSDIVGVTKNVKVLSNSGNNGSPKEVKNIQVQSSLKKSKE